MIFDRTQTDVENAIRLRSEKVQSFQELTEAEIEILEKGTLTVNTINRIEMKQAELKNLFADIGYVNVQIHNLYWAQNQIFKGADFERLLNNTEFLKGAFFTYRDTPETPGSVSYHWRELNALEKILHDLDVMINDVKSHYRECGDCETGGE